MKPNLTKLERELVGLVKRRARNVAACRGKPSEKGARLAAEAAVAALTAAGHGELARRTYAKAEAEAERS